MNQPFLTRPATRGSHTRQSVGVWPKRPRSGEHGYGGNASHLPTRVRTTILVLAFLTSPVAAADWPQWGGSPLRNNVAEGRNIPVEWNVGGFERKTGAWKKEQARNIKWV